MLLGFVGLGAVVETAYMPALRNLYGDSLCCVGFDVQPAKQPADVTCCASLAELLATPLDTLFITTASLHHLDVLEQALAAPIARIVVEKPIVATLSQIEKLKTLLVQPGVADRVLALDHWMARNGAMQLALEGSVHSGWAIAHNRHWFLTFQTLLKLTVFCRSRADITLQESLSRSILPPVSRTRVSFATRMA